MDLMHQARNAKITATELGFNNGILTFNLTLQGDGWGVEFGNYALDEYSEVSNKRLPTAKGFEVITNILKVVGVESWEDLPGKFVRVEDMRLGSKCTGIGNIMKNKWFDIEKFFEETKE